MLSGSRSPIGIDLLGAQGHGRRRIGALRAQAAFFHAHIDDQSESVFERAEALGLTLLLPVLVIAQSVLLGLRIADRVLPGWWHFPARWRRRVHAGAEGRL